MARQVVNKDKLAEAQEAADAALEAATLAAEAATLAAEKVAELADPTKEQGNSDTAGRQGVTARPLDDAATVDGYRIIRNGQDFSVEGVFRQQDGSQRFRTANGFPSEAAARQWVYDQLAEDE